MHGGDSVAGEYEVIVVGERFGRREDRGDSLGDTDGGAQLVLLGVAWDVALEDVAGVEQLEDARVVKGELLERARAACESVNPGVADVADVR